MFAVVKPCTDCPASRPVEIEVFDQRHRTAARRDCRVRDLVDLLAKHDVLVAVEGSYRRFTVTSPFASMKSWIVW